MKSKCVTSGPYSFTSLWASATKLQFSSNFVESHRSAVNPFGPYSPIGLFVHCGEKCTVSTRNPAVRTSDANRIRFERYGSERVPPAEGTTPQSCPLMSDMFHSRIRTV